MIKPTGAANYAVSRQGTLFYVPGILHLQCSMAGAPKGHKPTAPPPHHHISPTTLTLNHHQQQHLNLNTQRSTHLQASLNSFH